MSKLWQTQADKNDSRISSEAPAVCPESLSGFFCGLESISVQCSGLSNAGEG